MQISNLSYIHTEAKIGKNCQIDPFAVIHEDVVIGDDCSIGSHVVLYPGTRIGKANKIYPSAVIGGDPQDLKYKGEKTTTEIGDNNIIREFVTINKGTEAAFKTSIGNNNLLMAYVHVAHDCLIGNNCILANNVTLAGHIEIEDFAILEGLVAVQQFVRIGSHCFVAGTSKVRKNIPPYVKAAREPLSYVGLNSVGLRRRNFSPETIALIQDIYRILFQQGYAVSKALEIIEKDIENCSEKSHILNFVKNSPKGIIRGFVEVADDE